MSNLTDGERSVQRPSQGLCLVEIVCLKTLGAPAVTQLMGTVPWWCSQSYVVSVLTPNVVNVCVV
jgi:hypothetical protein